MKAFKTRRYISDFSKLYAKPKRQESLNLKLKLE